MDAKKTGELIATLRKEQHLNQNELAERIGVTNKAISRWETGRGYPDIETLPKIADVLNISIPELLSGKRNQRSEFVATEQPKLASAIPPAIDHDTSLKTVCQYAGEQTRKQKKKIVLLRTILVVAVFFFSLITFLFQVLPGVLDVYMATADAFYSYNDFYWSIVGSEDCIVASDYKSLTYLGKKYIPIRLNGYDAVEGEEMVDECQVEGAGFLGKLFFGETLYEVKNIPNQEMVYLQTDYDFCISRYFVLETEYDRYRQMLEEADFSRYFGIYENESCYRWEREVDADLSAWLHAPDSVAVSHKPDHTDVVNVRVYDKDHIFCKDAGTIYQTDDGYYWFPEALASDTYEPDSAGLGQYFPVRTGEYFPIDGFDNELNELFSN